MPLRNTFTSIKPRLQTPHAMILTLVLFILLLPFVPVLKPFGVDANKVKVIRGVHVYNQDLSGKTASEATELLRSLYKQVAVKPVNVQLDSNTWSVLPKELHWSEDVNQVVTEALAVGRRGSFSARLREQWQATTSGIPVLPQNSEFVHYTRGWLGKYVPLAYRPPQNAYRDVESGAVVPERPGRQLNIEASIEAIQQALWGNERHAMLVTDVIKPRVTTEDLAKVQSPVVLSRFSTRFNPTVKNRVSNIRIAASMINGSIVWPGEVFSFNEIVGPRLESTGYKSAPELLRGDLVPGIGGGVCQVSSTLYNAVLFSNLVVVERYKHSAVLGYVPAGRDATVSYGQLDFRFRNSLDYPIVIRSFIEGDKLSVGLWGKSPLTYNVKLTSDSKSLSSPIVERRDTTLPPGRRVVVEPGKPGQLVVISKLVSNSGNKVTKRSIVSKNLYPAQPKVVRVGVIRQATNEVEPSQNNTAEIGSDRESTPDLTANNSENQSTTDGGVQNDAIGNNSNSVKADTGHVTESTSTVETGETGSGITPGTETIPGVVSTISEQAGISQ